MDGKRRTVENGLFYVAITRIRSSNHLHLKNFNESYIRISAQVSQEMKRLRSKLYDYCETPLRIKTHKKEISISYLNISSLRKHINDLKSDFNLLDSTVLCIAETWLRPSDSGPNYYLENFNILERLDGLIQTNGKGLLLYSKSNIRYSIYNSGNDEIQWIMANIDDLICCFVYFPPGTALYMMSDLFLSWFNSQTVPDLIIGDFNKSTAEMEVLSSKYSLLCLTESKTTRGSRDIDHIFWRKSDHMSVSAQVYNVFYSDHDAVSVRVEKRENSMLLCNVELPTDVII
ncbi:uncharacterized protein LOC120343523 [Styela clava]